MASEAQKSAAALAIEKSPGYYWFLVFYLVGLSMLASFINDMFTPSLPQIVKFFHTDVSTSVLAVSLTLVGAALGQFFMGPLSDQYGRKPILAFGITVTILAGFLCIFSKEIHVFLAYRLVQGFGASAGYFLAKTIPADLYTGRALAKFMALIGAINGLAPASAPILGGFIAQAYSWKGVFVVLSGFGVLLLCVFPFMKETLPPAQRSAGGFKTALGNYKALLINKPFMVHVCLKGLVLALLFAYVSAAPFIVETHYGFSESEYGLIIGLNASMLAVGTIAALKFRYLKQAGLFGIAVLVVDILAQVLALWFYSPFWLFEVLCIVMVLAMGMIFTAANTIAMNEGRALAGEASAVLGIAGYIFAGIVTPLVGIGDVMKSAALTFLGLTAFIVILALIDLKFPRDLEK